MRYNKETSPSLQKIDRFRRETLFELINDCTEPAQLMFKRLYSNTNLHIDLRDLCMYKISSDKIDWAIVQCENTLSKNEPK